MEPNRVAIVLSRALPAGAAANVSALLMGQLVRDSSDIYSDEVPVDALGNRHAAIKFSTVVLKAKDSQLSKFAKNAQDEGLTYSCFSGIGQTLNNEFTEYKRRLASEPAELVGVAIYGSDTQVRTLTRPFSVLQ